MVAGKQVTKQATLQEYAAGVNQLNRELQRQTDAYAYFRAVQAQLAQLAEDPNAKLDQPLPFVTMHFPVSTGTAPAEVKLDLNTLPTETLLAFQPMFDQLSQVAGYELLSAWEELHDVCKETHKIVDAARAAQSHAAAGE